MPDLDIDKILGAMESESVGQNAMSIFDMLEMANKAMTQIATLMDKLDKMGLKPLLVRGAGKKLGIDAEAPLKSDSGVTPATDVHKNLFNQLNTMSEKQLGEMFNGQTSDDKSTTD